MNLKIKKVLRGETIKINYNKLKEITKRLISKLDHDFKNKKDDNNLLALFYIDIDNKKYYYTYNELDNNFSEFYNSYQIVNYRKAKRLLLEQIYE